VTEQELRALVRSVVAARLGEGGRVGGPAPSGPRRASPAPPSASGVTLHLSHGRFTLAPDPDGHCFIEPGVACNHCGFCQSYGH
jgi:hypothetical protein